MVVLKMQKSEDAVILKFEPNKDITYLIRDEVLITKPLVPYHPVVCEFLNDLSGELLSDKESARYSDVMTFAFWCRRANIVKLSDSCKEEEARLGLGLVFHIAPSNIPINFAFTFVFGLLSGNANIVKVSSKHFPQVDIICDVVRKLFTLDKYSKLKTMNAIVRYEYNDEITKMFSANCNARIIWGGDTTISNIRQFPIPNRSVDIAFADRYSLCIIDGAAIMQLDEVGLKKLAENFYNDTYLVDQNACSSPHLVVWLGNECRAAQQKFWDAVFCVVASKYELVLIHAVDKYSQLCQNAIEINQVKGFYRYGSHIYRVNLDSLPDNTDVLRGKCGYFYEYNTNDINTITHVINTKYQTLTYFGVDKLQFLNFVIENQLLGIDRIVPIGKALDIGVIWDGYDVIKNLSRIIEVR